MTYQHPTRSDLPETTRAQVADLLNASLATAIDLALQAKQAHWNVKGPSFAALHALFDQVHADASGWVDTLAERAVQLGGVAQGTLQAVGDRTALAVYPLDLVDGRAHVDALASAMARFAAGTRAAIERTATAGDAVTSDLFTGLTSAADKTLWLLEAHLQSDR